MSAGAGDGSDRGAPRKGAPSRWAKGISGNPKGRPRKASDLSSTSSSMTELFISEAERQLNIPEDGKSVQMSAAQIVLRATFASAAKGNANAQRTFLQMTLAAQTQAAKLKRDDYEQASLTQRWTQVELDVWTTRGLDAADFPRHPSDIELNSETLEVKNYLIYTSDAIETRKRAIAFRDYLIEKIPELLDVAEHDGDDLLLEWGRERALRMIETLNAQLPARFRRVPAEDEPPLSADHSPEEIWRTMAEQDAACLRRKAGRSKTQARPRRRTPKATTPE